jgi:hypothetical protein
MYLVASGPNIPAVSFRCLSPVTPVAQDPGHQRCTTCRFHRGLSSTIRSKPGDEAGWFPAQRAASYLQFGVGLHAQRATAHAGA